ncbi:2-oxo-4-hydroxy-4-carboxy-5-ureidoimidazoline decarboxylase [Metabacillus litoralis]|uniref:2-oxo-4-hydroxy-4-carboxy-5-ureidoimidazoline decarboxylase n=1 Tax=Metabacillus TaxID=2675233 RepID=UPI001E3B1D2A|nr:2-oxo-4-hydroxy-4-carboxy-5-ureidoimidazoline decarboxylase [Metabacillus litoralis]MCM3159892.1 2-oxo-4-hydroxy-4-carboxy-5-ureidoimidazoline decarboxylase [Metabacillus litoralis]MCM3408472.1 2-oxo-4-hydroxy-4-carboxy-5-ureidoimidazoline decarboxylase [Metabacillus litoralis]UHA59860.1 2-oxo-4-hydroxy-4-carboxy-5-ureidoimidazoline decarboxylase [Metabacillus litoralis]
MVSIKQLNEVSHSDFIHLLKDIFEHSPWVPERTWNDRPFSSVGDLHGKMVGRLNEATDEEKLGLIKAHPNLGTRLVMSHSSVQEQANAGLSELTAEEYTHFSLLNRQYMEKFGFPFIMAVKGRTKDEIYSSMEKRISHGVKGEFETALTEIEKIALFRLCELISN